MELNKTNIRKICGIIAFGVVLALLLANISSVMGVLTAAFAMLTPFLLGAAMAFIVNVPMSFFERKLFPKQGRIADKLKRPVSLVITLLVIFFVGFMVVFLLVPELSETIKKVASSIPGFIVRATEYSNSLAEKYPEAAEMITAYVSDLDSIIESVTGFLRLKGQSMITTAISAASSFMGVLINTLVGFVFSVYLLACKEKLAVQSKRLLYTILPERLSDSIIAVCRLSEKTFSKFLSGQCLEALILGAMFFITMSILRFPYALLISVLIAFTALIPIFGAFIGCAIGAFLIFVAEPISALWFVIMFLVLQQIEGNFIYPYVVGNSVGLPSMWVLFAVTIGGQLMGVAGMLIFIPLFSVLYVLIGRAVEAQLRKRGISSDKWTRPIAEEIPPATEQVRTPRLPFVRTPQQPAASQSTQPSSAGRRSRNRSGRRRR